MAYVFEVTWEITKPNLSTATLMKKASGISGRRFNELRKSFGEADISVDLSLKKPEGQNRFVREVHAWLDKELSEEEKRAIFCPERPLAPFIMCHIAAYFKRLVRSCEKKKNKKRIAQEEQCLEEEEHHGRSADNNPKDNQYCGGPADEETSDVDGPDGNSPEGSEVGGIDEMADAGNEDPIWQGFSGVNESMIEPDREFELGFEDVDLTGIDQSMILEEADRDFELESEDVDEHDLTGINQSMILEQADREYELESEDVNVELVEREMEEPEAGPEADPDSDRARHTREIDELIASATRLRAAMLEWDAARFASEVSVEYKTLHSLIPIPTDPASASASASTSASASASASALPSAYTSFYAKIRNNLVSVRDELEQRKPKFEQIWGPEVRNSTMGAHFRCLIQSKPSGNPTPFMVIAAGPSGGGKTHSMIRPNPADPPVLQQLLLEAFFKHGDLKMTVNVMSGKNSVPVPLFDPTSKGKGKGKVYPLRQFLTSEMEIHEFATDLMGHIPRSDNGVNHVSSRVHVVIDAFSEGLLVFTIIDLCGDESSEVRGRLTSTGKSAGRSANKESSDRIAGDLSFLKRLFTDLKLATAPSQPMNAESWRSQGIFGRECALTRAFLNRLTMVPKLHIIMFGHGTTDQSRKDLIRSLNVWSPPVMAGRAMDDKPRAIIVGGKRSKANDLDGKRSKRAKFQR